jgi:ribosomal protein S18 acetylase RimI-like enzyme
MASYRFCRTDDIALLVDAYNACRSAECREPALTVEGFKRDARELGLWASSCMLAFEGTLPIAVLLGAKQGDANLVHRIAVSAGQARRGHGRHLIDSLRQKVAILGPPRLVVEVPAANEGACRFFERCGFSRYARYADFAADAPASPDVGEASLVAAATVEELLEAGALEPSALFAWERSVPSITSRRRQIEGLVIASDERIEAMALFRSVASGEEILRLRATRPEPLAALVAALRRRSLRPIAIPKVSPAEIEFALLEALGFRRGSEYIGLEADLAA